MNEQLLIQGVLHEAFTQTSYAPEAEAADFLRRRFPYPNFCITAFSLSGTRLADSYRHQLISMIPKYTAGLTKFPTFAYHTENHEFLLLFNYPEESEPQEYIRQSYEYFKQRHNCTVFWGISRPCVGLSEFIFAKKEALTALSFSLTDSHDDITVYSDQMFIPAENSYGCFYPQTAADLLIKGMKNHDTDLIHFILTVLEDENTRLRPFSSEQMIAGQMLALHNAVTATFFGLNPVKYGFLEQLFAFQQEIIGCQGNFEHYFSHLHDLCLSVSASLAGQRMSKKKELVQETADFILQNYADANLNLSGTAQHFQVSKAIVRVFLRNTPVSVLRNTLKNAALKKAVFCCRTLPRQLNRLPKMSAITVCILTAVPLSGCFISVRPLTGNRNCRKKQKYPETKIPRRDCQILSLTVPAGLFFAFEPTMPVPLNASKANSHVTGVLSPVWTGALCGCSGCASACACCASDTSSFFCIVTSTRLPSASTAVTFTG